MEQLPVHQRSSREGQQPTRNHRALRGISPASFTEYVEISPQEASSSDWMAWVPYWRAVTRHKLLIAACACCGVALGLVLSLRATPVYSTSATLEIQQVTEQPFEGISFMNRSDPYLLQTQVQLLRSGVLRRRVHARMLKEGPAADPGGAARTAGALPADGLGTLRAWFGLAAPAPTREQAVAHAMGAVRITPVRDTRLVQIAVESTLPQVAAEYANKLAEEFIQQNLDERWSLYQTTGKWLARAQDDLKARLEASEKQLLDYASASGLVVMSNDQNIGEQRLAQLQAEVSRAQAERIEKESTYRTARSQPAESLANVLTQGALGHYEVKLADLRRELADAGTALTAAHPKVKRIEAQIAELETARSRESQNVLNRMRTEYEAALHRERQLLGDFNDQSRILSGQDQKLIRYKLLQQEVDTYRKLYETTLQKSKEASVASAISPVNVRVVDAAGVPRLPYKPDVVRNLAMGVLGGLALGVGMVLFRERTDATIRMPGSIPAHLNLRELGVILAAESDPDLPSMSGRVLRALPSGPSRAARPLPRANLQVLDPVELATWNRKASLLAESFRATLTSILTSDDEGHQNRVILVTSPSPREGKTTITTNLAIALAEIEQRVLLVDADMRRPRIHSIFNQANTWGLSDLLREKTPCGDYPLEALARKTHVPRLSLLSSGPGSVNVSRLLYSARMAELLGRLRGEFDAVVIDSPPVLQVADARILSRLADAVILVVRAGQTTREAATAVVHLFDADGVRVIGTVLNDWNPRTMGHGGYPSNYVQYYSEASNL